jgi:hypothetical protein
MDISLLLLLFLLPNLLNSFGGLFGGGNNAQQVPMIYINQGGSSTGFNPDPDVQYTATWNSTTGWTYKPNVDADVDNPWDLALTGALIGGGIGSMVPLPGSTIVGALGGGLIGLVADALGA